MSHAHRLFDGALDDQFVGDLGGGHELVFAATRDVKIDGKQLLLVLLYVNSI